MNIMRWIIALRPGCGALMGLLVISGFYLTEQTINWYIIAVVFCITSTAMLWNDFYDKELDFGKGKTLAIEYPKQFIFYSTFFTVVSFALSILVAYQDLFSGLLCFALLVISLIYNNIQNIPVVKNLSISISAAVVLLFPLFKNGNDLILWGMLVSVFVIISAREYMKDVEDMEVDRGKKRTLALLMGSKISPKTVRLWKNILSFLLLATVLVGFIS